MKIKHIHPIALEEHHDGASWGAWSCEVELEDGTILEGYVDSDGHTIAEDTLELSIEDTAKYGLDPKYACF